MRQLIEVFRALSDENRVRLLKMLQQRSMCVTEMTQVLGISQSSVSHHLRVLKGAGLVANRRHGLWIHYSLATDSFNPYAHPMLEVLKAWLDKSPTVVQDSQRMRAVARPAAQPRA